MNSYILEDIFLEMLEDVNFIRIMLNSSSNLSKNVL